MLPDSYVPARAIIHDYQQVFCHTRNCVVQDKAKESADEHVCGEEHNNHLVQFFDSFEQRT